MSTHQGIIRKVSCGCYDAEHWHMLLSCLWESQPSTWAYPNCPVFHIQPRVRSASLLPCAFPIANHFVAATLSILVPSPSICRYPKMVWWKEYSTHPTHTLHSDSNEKRVLFCKHERLVMHAWTVRSLHSWGAASLWAETGSRFVIQCASNASAVWKCANSQTTPLTGSKTTP